MVELVDGAAPPACSAIKLSTERPISPFARTRVHACSFRGDRAEPASHFREPCLPSPREAPGTRAKGVLPSLSLLRRATRKHANTVSPVHPLCTPVRLSLPPPFFHVSTMTTLVSLPPLFLFLFFFSRLPRCGERSA